MTQYARRIDTCLQLQDVSWDDVAHKLILFLNESMLRETHPRLQDENNFDAGLVSDFMDIGFSLCAFEVFLITHILALIQVGRHL